MKLTRRSTLRQVALAVATVLRRHRVRGVLTGGACASLHSDGQYVSTDLDFVLQSWVSQRQLDDAMAEIGFRRDGARYVHPDTPFYVEFPPGPLAVGDDHQIRPVALSIGGHSALALSPTDSCRDRLAAFYHWNDRQSLQVAALIAAQRRVNLARIRRWSEAEGHAERFGEFLTELRRTRKRTRQSAVKRGP